MLSMNLLEKELFLLQGVFVGEQVCKILPYYSLLKVAVINKTVLTLHSFIRNQQREFSLSWFKLLMKLSKMLVRANSQHIYLVYKFLPMHEIITNLERTEIYTSMRCILVYSMCVRIINLS